MRNIEGGQEVDIFLTTKSFVEILMSCFKMCGGVHQRPFPFTCNMACVIAQL